MSDNEVERLAIEFYDSQLRQELETNYRDEFVAVEPISGDYFIAKTSLDAALAAKRVWSDRLPFVIRIGHSVAHHLGCW